MRLNVKRLLAATLAATSLMGLGTTAHADDDEAALNFRNAKDLTVGELGEFDVLNFYIPADAADGDTLLIVTDTNGTDLSGKTVNAGVDEGATFNDGDVVTLIRNDYGLNTDGTGYGTISEGVSVDYDLAIEPSGSNSVIARITNRTNDATLPQTELIASSDLTALQVAEFMSDKLIDWLPPSQFDFTDDFDAGTDLATDSGGVSDSDGDSGSEDNTAEVAQKPPSGFELFAGMGAGSMRTKTGNGSYIESTNRGFDLGFGRSLEYSNSRLIFAPLVEYATGDYDTYLSDGTHGKGSTKYVAGGLIGRVAHKNGNYIEASARGGRSERDFSSYDMTSGGVPVYVHYDKTSAPVFAGHLRLGKQLRLNKNNLLDVYGICFYSHQGDMNLHLSTGETYKFSSAHSTKTRLGYRLTTRTSRISRIYTGLVMQHESNSSVTGVYKGYRTPSSGSSGTSGMMEVGWMIKPTRSNPWMLDLNATGFVGHQRGVSGSLKFQKQF